MSKFQDHHKYIINTIEARDYKKAASQPHFFETTRIVSASDTNALSTMRNMLESVTDSFPFIELNDNMFLTVTHRKGHKFTTTNNVYVFVREKGGLVCYAEKYAPYDPRPLQNEAKLLAATNTDPKTAELLTRVQNHTTKLTKRVLDRFENIKKKIKK